MRKYLLLAIGMLYGILFSQATGIEWQKSLGGTDFDWAYSVIQTTDGGYIVAGQTKSNNGDVIWNHGVADVWIVKLDSNSQIQWQKILGGTVVDGARSIQQTTDGGYIIAAYSTSANGDVYGNHGGADAWIIKMDQNGNIQWSKAIGGSNGEVAYAVRQTSDGGYIVAGDTYSNDGDVSGNHGGSDYWVVKLYDNGNIQWQRTLGGGTFEEAYSVVETTDGGFVVTGWTQSNDGDVSGNHGESDIWTVKLDNTGNTVWQKTYGGSGTDRANSIQQTPDGGLIIAGMSNSVNGDVSGNHYGTSDCWVVKTDSEGNIQWEKSLGGSGSDYANSVQLTLEGGFIVAGSSSSADGDVSGNLGNGDYWVVKLDDNGLIEWENSYGGSGNEEATTIQQTTDGGYIVAGFSPSTDGDVTGNHGGHDFWVVKLNGTSYDVITASSPVAGGTTTGGGNYSSGSEVTVTATPANGYAFQKWMENDNTVSTSASYTFIITADRNLVAKFKSTNNQGPVYTIAASCVPLIGGIITGVGNYAEGKTVTLKATANENYVFESWMEGSNVVATTKKYQFTASGNRTLKAKFVKPSYAITTLSVPSVGGTTSGNGTYIIGKTITVKAVPNAGYIFESWMEGTTVVATTKNYKFTVNANRTLKAKFVKPSYTITTKSIPITGGTTSGDGAYISGKTVTVKAVASAGYIFESWMEGTTVVAITKNYKFTVNANRTLKAKFTVVNSAKINTLVNLAEAGTVSGSGDYNYGAMVTLIASTKPGYKFVGWMEDGKIISQETTYSFEASQNRNLIGFYERKGNSTKLESEFLIYPNPFSDILNIKSNQQKIRELKIYDLAGKLIDIQQVNEVDQYELNTKDLVKGIYILQLITDEGVRAFKVFKK